MDSCKKRGLIKRLMQISNFFKTFTYQKSYLYLTFGLTLSLPLSRAAVSFFILMLGSLWLYEGNLKKKIKHIWKDKVLQALLIFLIFTSLSIFWSSDTKEALHILRLYSYWLALFVIATSVRKENSQKIITIFLYAMLISEIIAYGIYFELWHIKGASPSNPSPFMFWIDYSVFLALTSILLFNRLFSKSYSLKEKIPLAIFFISANTNLFLGYGRTGQVALIVAIFIMVMLNMKLNIKSFIVSTVILLSLYGTAYNFSHTFKTRVNSAINDIHKMQSLDFNSSWGTRVVYWMLTYDTLKEHPLIGVGIGDYKENMSVLLEKKSYPISKETERFMKSSHTHNEFLLVAMQTGLIGLFLMLNIIYQLLKMKIKNEEIKKLSILFVTIYFVSCMAEPLWLKQFTIALFIVFIGMFISHQNPLQAHQDT